MAAIDQPEVAADDLQDAKDALAALGMVFHDDQEAGDAMAALAAAGLI